MIYKDHPKHNLIITGIVTVIGIFIVFFAILPFLNIQSNFLKGLLIVAILVIAAFPLVKYLTKGKKGDFEHRNGRKLK